MAFDIKKIPFFKNLDMTNPQTKKSVIMLLFAAAAFIMILIFASTGDGEKKVTPATKADSSIPHIQEGEDKDHIEGHSVVDIRGRGRGDNGAFARKMYDDGKSLENILTGEGEAKPDGSTVPSGSGDSFIEAATSSAGAAYAGISNNGQPDQPDQPEQPAEKTKRKPLTPADHATTGRVSGPSQAIAKSSSETKSVDQQTAEAVERKRARIRQMGLDPDTGMPLDQITGQPTVDATTAAQPAEEKTENDEPPAGVEKSVVSVRGKGAMSSFGSGTSRTGDSGFASFGSAEEEAVSSGAKFFKVAFAYDEKVRAGQRVTLRLREKITVDGYELPLNSIVYATCSIKGERLMLKVKNIDINGKAFYLNYDAFDVDWEDGLYCPSKTSSATAKEALRQAGQVVTQTLQSAVTGGIAGRILSSGTSMIQNANGEVTVSVMEGYEFYLMPSTKSQ